MKKLYSQISAIIDFVEKTAKIVLLVGVVAETLQFFTKRAKEVLNSTTKSE